MPQQLSFLQVDDGSNDGSREFLTDLAAALGQTSEPYYHLARVRFTERISLIVNRGGSVSLRQSNLNTNPNTDPNANSKPNPP